MAHPFADPRKPRILLVKTSSLGDVLHNLPVVSDIARHYPGAQIDWLVEESFAALPGLHPAVRNVIPVAIRRWRDKLLSAATWHEIAALRRTLASQTYDIAIDTQGLLKSALLMRCAHGLRCGFDRHSAREPLAARLYQQTFPVVTGQHAVERNRQLAAQALGYTLKDRADYGIAPPAIPCPAWLAEERYMVLLHATSRADKLWDEASWIALGRFLQEKNIRCVLPWGNATEQARSRRLAAAIPDAIVPPRLNLNEAAALLGGARAVIGVDTGLAHLAAALNVPTVGIYTATDPALTGLYAGTNVTNLGGAQHAPDVAAVVAALQQAAVC
ncbi:MAG: lipopolysaccharide heptosyltransferase I [Gallionella sp.]|nr:lipopolysaccharide heptosyltransferase I [Gallionella sp.]